MKKLYQKTFEQTLAQTYAPPEQVEAQRSALASRCSKPESEVTAMTTKPIRPIRILVTAAAVAAALTVGALAASGVLSRITFHTGATIEYGVNEDGTEYSTVSGTSLDESYPVEVRNDRAWFTTETGEELDITGQFSETEPYVYSYVDEGGLTHDIVVGGTLESFGLFEYLYDEGGGYTASTGYLPPESPAYPAWRAAYEAEHGIPAPSGGEPVEQDSSSGLIWLDPQLAVEDGKVLLTVGGETTDITGRFSESEAYVYTVEGEDGLPHVILVGGTAEEPYEAEIILRDDGTWCAVSDAPENSTWFDAYVEANLSR